MFEMEVDTAFSLKCGIMAHHQALMRQKQFCGS